MNEALQHPAEQAGRKLAPSEMARLRRLYPWTLWMRMLSGNSPLGARRRRAEKR